MNINGATIDIAVNDNNGYTTNFYLTGGTMSASGGGTFHFANGYGVTTYSSTATSVISSGIVTRDNGTMNFDVASGTTASGVDLLVSGNITALTFVGGVEGINKTGPGVMVLAGINTYTGGTTVNGGVLQLDAGGSTGAICGVLTINPGAAVKLNADNALGWSSGASWVTTVNVNGATIDFSGIGNNGYTTNFYLTGGTMSSTGGGPFHFSNGYGVTTYSSTATSVINSDIVVRDNGTMNFDVASGTTASGVDLLVSGNISPLTFIGGVEGINKTGSGVMVLSGNNSYDGGVEGINKTGSGVMVLSGNNSYDGGTTVNEGTLVVTSSTALPDGTSLTVGAGGTFVFDPSLSLGGAPVAASAAVTAVPEPGTLALLVVGLSGTAGRLAKEASGEQDPITITTENTMRNCTLAVMFILARATFADGQAALDHEEFVGPFPSWSNVKTDFGAVGNGAADDTAALQKALDSFQQKSNVLYLPAGTYRITKGLTMTNRQCLSILGEDPAKTEIKWDGPEEGAMLLCNGVCYAKFARITWNGGGKKVTAIFHESENTKGVGTGNEHSDQVFVDLAFGIRAGKPHCMDAETAVLRCKFLRCSEAGVRIQSFNALDWFVWDSEFDGCALGVTNDPGAGHFHLYRNIFRNSTVADIALRNAEYFGIRHNLSVGSKRFFEGRNIGGWAVPTMLQGNTIIETREPVAILVNNPGPTLLIDNVIKSRADVTEGPVVRLVAELDGEYVAVGNTVTVATPFIARHRFLELQTKVVPAEKIVPPALPGAVTPPLKNRPVIEVPAKADDKAIQAAINQAAAARETARSSTLPGEIMASNRPLPFPPDWTCRSLATVCSKPRSCAGVGPTAARCLPWPARPGQLSATCRCWETARAPE